MVELKWLSAGEVVSEDDAGKQPLRRCHCTLVACCDYYYSKVSCPAACLAQANYCGLGSRARAAPIGDSHDAAALRLATSTCYGLRLALGFHLAFGVLRAY